MYIMTHSYFLSYHALTTPLLRKWWTNNQGHSFRQWAGGAVLVAVLAYITAFMEAFTLESFPYYVIKNRTWFYVVGSSFYALYFVVSFPMFARINEHGPPRQWTIERVAIEAAGEWFLYFYSLPNILVCFVEVSVCDIYLTLCVCVCDS
jgi:cycloeucalenol cycloisomerase